MVNCPVNLTFHSHSLLDWLNLNLNQSQSEVLQAEEKVKKEENQSEGVYLLKKVQDLLCFGISGGTGWQTTNGRRWRFGRRAQRVNFLSVSPSQEASMDITTCPDFFLIT